MKPIAKLLMVAVLALALAPSFALAAEDAGSPLYVQGNASSSPSGITISVTRASTGKLTLKAGSSYKLGAKASAGKLSYKSSSPKVAKVTAKGVVKAKKPGKTVVTVTAKKGKKKAVKKVKLTVIKAPKFKKVKSVKAKAGASKLAVGKTTKVKVTLNPKKASNGNVTFKSSKPKVASVSATGIVTAKKPGTATITVKSCQNAKAKAKVKIRVTSAAKGTTQKAAFDAGVLAVNAADAKVAKGGRSARVSQAALPSVPARGQVVVIADDDLQGTAIKVTKSALNSDGTYTVSGARPSFDEVFDKLDISGEEQYGPKDVTWTADGVTVEAAGPEGSGLATQSAVKAQDTASFGELKVTISPKLLKSIVKQDAHGKQAVSGSITVSVKPSVEYDLAFEWFHLSCFKLLLKSDYKLSGTLRAAIDGEVPIATLGGAKTGVDLYLAAGVDGTITLKVKAKSTLGLDSTASGGPLVADSGASGELSYSAGGNVGVGVKPRLGVLCFDIGELKGELGGQAQASQTRRSAAFDCTDVGAWLYLKASYKIDDFLAGLGGIDAKGTWSIISADNSPVKWSQHFENGQAVPECTWGGEELPEREELEQFLSTLVRYRSGDDESRWEYNSEFAADYPLNILPNTTWSRWAAVATGDSAPAYPVQFSMESHYTVNSGAREDPLGKFEAFTVNDASSVEWLLKYIFNVSDDVYADIVDAGGTSPYSYGRYYFLDGKVYTESGPVGQKSGAIVELLSWKKSGDRYNIHFRLLPWWGNPVSRSSSDGSYELYAQAGLKEIGGKNYWSLYKLSESSDGFF